MAALFVAALSFSAVLPVLPLMLRRSGLSPADVSTHTGVLTGIYMFAVALFAPLWGWYSDRVGRRPVIILGLAGATAALLMFAFFRSLAFAYVARALTGVFAAAVIPASTASVGDTTLEPKRAERFAKLTASSLFGFLAGPSLSAWLSNMFPAGAFPNAALYGSILASAILTAVVMIVAILLFPRKRASRKTTSANVFSVSEVRPALLVFVVMYALASFEIGITLLAQQRFSWTIAQIGLFFASCSAVMLLVQGVLFPVLVKRVPKLRLLALGLAAIVVGLALTASSTTYGNVLLLVVLVATGASVVVPAITYWASLSAGSAQGASLGAQTAASSLGQALGSASAGVLFSVSYVAPFWTAGAAVIGGAIALRSITAPAAAENLKQRDEDVQRIEINTRRELDGR